MPARVGPGFEHEELFRAYCLSHGVLSAEGTYQSCMNVIAAHLHRRLGPEMLRSEGDVQTMTSLISETRFNSNHRSNFKSVMRKYVEMVRSNFDGQFDKYAAPAIDVDINDLPPRIRLEISRIVRDTSIARELKRAYDGQCQICGKRLELAPGEFYVEAHHLRPLGQPHNGPDVKENIVCACPNCHVLLDYGALPIGLNTLQLKLHKVERVFIDYHNDRCR